MIRPMETRFVIRPDARGYTVRDLWTGDAANLAGTPQIGLSKGDAEHTAELLNATATEAPPPVHSDATT